MSNSVPISAFDSSGAPAFKFEQIGDKVVGRIVSMNERQQREFGTQKPLFFESGDPRMEWVITLATESGESGSLFARGGNYDVGTGQGAAMLIAIHDAAIVANVTELMVGGQLAVQYTGLSKPKPGLNPTKLFTAAYQPPAPQATPVDDLFAS
jgi:hypothetical protein